MFRHILFRSDRMLAFFVKYWGKCGRMKLLNCTTLIVNTDMFSIHQDIDPPGSGLYTYGGLLSCKSIFYICIINIFHINLRKKCRIPFSRTIDERDLRLLYKWIDAIMNKRTVLSDLSPRSHHKT